MLVGIFAAHHSVFARDPVKRWLARRVPERLLRSVYVWTASLLLLGTCAAWRPIGHDLFDVNGVTVLLHAAVQFLGAGGCCAPGTAAESIRTAANVIDLGVDIRNIIVKYLKGLP